MSIADAAEAPRRSWWLRYIPPSWVLMSPPERERERDMDLDGTGAYRRRWDDQPPPPPPAPRVSVPVGVIVTVAIYLVGQLGAGIWWAATSQSRIMYLEQKNGELWQLLETQRLRTDRIEREQPELIRAKIRETMDDWGYLRIRPRKEE